MHIPKRIIRLARDRALSSFSSLAEQIVVEADTLNSRAMGDAGAAQLRELGTVRAFLRGEARNLRGRMDRHFAGLLERAMLTMHADERSDARQAINYDTLTLVDDDVVTRQIDIDRLVARLREAEAVPLGRVNLTIAILHNDREARERENPFRPYLLARALYEGLREVIWDEAQSKLLFEALGAAMAKRLPGFYTGIVEVFEAGGVTARLTARPSAMSRAERDRLAWQRAAQHLLGKGGAGAGGAAGPHPGPSLGLGPGAGLRGGAPPQADQAAQDRLLPRLQRLRDIHAAGAEAGLGARQQDLLEVVWNIFHQPMGGHAERRLSGPRQRGPLDQALFALQLEVGAGAAPPQPLALREQLAHAEADAAQRRTMDIVALLFESMLHDDMLADAIKPQLGRLYLPILRAALIEPSLLHDDQHPARRLLDRLGTLGTQAPEGAPGGAALEPELESIISTVLDLFDDDMHLFADADKAIDDHVSARLAAADPRIAVLGEAVAEAVDDSARLARTGGALSRVLQPLQVDPRLADFILGTWARVLSQSGPGAEAGAALLPELLWSAQEKTTAEDRAALMRMLPDLVRRVREGMASIALPEAPSKAAFDRLVAVHMDVLGNRQESARSLMSLAQFRQHFRDFAIDAPNLFPEQGDSWLGKFELEAALARRGESVQLRAKAAARLAQASDAGLLSWARTGARFEIKVDGRYSHALLCAVSAPDHAFVFTVAGLPEQVLYLRGPLLEEMENYSLRPLEYAPLFDRAVESLMAGAESLSS